MKKKGKAFAVMAAIILSLLQVPAIESRAAGSTQLTGKAHVQTYGDMDGKVTYEGGIETLVLGTRGQAKRVESINIRFVNNTGYAGTVQYQVHRQTYGWTEWVNAGTPAGTTGQAKRLEAVRIRLTGELAEHYDVRYAAHAQTYGDAQGWVYNGALAGTTGEAKRLEEIRVQIIPKNTVNETESVSYRVHRQTYGWENTWRQDGQVSGTTGQAKRLEGICIDLKGSESGSIVYRTHVQTYGWLDWVSDGAMSGTQGEAKRLEAVQIKLTGSIADRYDVYYRVHAQHFGWMAWVKNGEPAGTSGYGYRLEAIQIVLVKKGEASPSAAYGGVTGSNTAGYSDKNTAVWHEARTQTVTMLRCNGCGRKYKDETEFNRHLNEDYDDQCDEEMTYTPKTYTFTLQEAYYEYAEAGRTCVPAEYEVRWVVTEESYVEKDVEWCEKYYYARCNQCKKRFYEPSYYIERYGYYDDDNSDMYPYAHLKAVFLEYKEGKTDELKCWGYSTGFSEWVPVGTRDIVHPERGYYEAVSVKEGYRK